MFNFRFSSLLVAASVAWILAVPVAARAQTACAALPAPSGPVIEVTRSQVGSLQSILDSAQSGQTIQLADGLYPLPQTLVMRVPGVTLRSKSGNRLAVVLDGRYAIGDVVLVQKSNVTIADLTLTRSNWHLVHVAPDGPLSGTLLHNIRGVDGSEQFVKVNPVAGNYADNGVVRCSSLEMTDVGRTFVRNNCYTGGIDIHQARGWQILSNVVSGFWCGSGLSEHAIHAWTGSRDTRVEGNVVINSARGIGFGLGEAVTGRTYGDAACSATGNVGHYGGAIVNNFVVANDPRLFGSSAGFDTGIGLEQSCQTNVLHNTVVSTTAPRSSSIEWRFPNTVVSVANNLATHGLIARDGARATTGGNIANVPQSLFVNVAAGNVHLVPGAATAIDKAAALSNPVAIDIDGEPRGTMADVGADEYRAATPSLTLSATSPVIAGGAIDVTWTTSADGVSSTDWIGLYATGAPDSASLERRTTAGHASATIVFTAPATAGTYEMRYFSGNGARLAVSNAITVTAPAPAPAPAPPPAPTPTPTPSGDTIAPVISIMWPRTGQTVGTTVAVSVTVSDNVGVVRTELYVDGALASTSTAQPFKMTWDAKAATRGAHSVKVKAYDAAGNSAWSPVITLYR